MPWKRLVLISAVLSSLLSIAAAGEMELGGFVQTDNRVLTDDEDYSLVDMYNTLRLEFKTDLSESVSAFSSMDIKYHNFPRGDSPAALSQRSEIDPMDMALWECYTDLYGFVFSDLDLRIGKQRISWGTADRLNPTDNLNPDDFSDPLDFGRKFPTTAFKAAYYLGDYTLTGVWLPSLRPVLLPTTGFSISGGQPPAGLPPGIQIAVQEDHLILPEKKLENSMAAVKIAGNVLNTDFSLSYFRGHDDIPLASSILMAPIDPSNPASMKLDTELTFPKIQAIGADAAGEFLSIGFWGEGTLFLPEEVTMNITTPDPQGQMQTVQQVALEDEPYVKCALGIDYTFKGGIYINAQYMHGFFSERGGDNLEDYLMARIEKKFLDDKLKTALGGGFEVKDMEDIAENYGFVVMPELSYYPIDNIEAVLGMFLLDGEDGTLFGNWKDQDQAYLKVKVNF